MREFFQAVPEGSRAVLIIDAVNQLNEYGGGHDMAWLPDNLPPRVKIIVSCMDEPEKEQAALSALRRRETPELKVEPLTHEERFEIVSQLPSISAKSLDPKQVALLMENPATTNPLYLTVALEELRGFGSFEKLNERIRSFPRTEGEKGLVELFLQVLERLERELGTSTVYSALSSIATSRYGLSEKELAEFLNRIKVGHEAATERSGQMLVALRQLRPYLLRRGPYIDFYHRNLYKSVRERYLWKEEVRQGIHHALAEYFNSKGLKSDRMLSEAPHHMTQAGMWDKLEALLTDLKFVEAKCGAGMTYELVADYSAVLEALPEAREERRKRDEHQDRIEKNTRDLIAFARGETSTLEIIPSVRPWTDEELEADGQRIVKNPSRLDRIRAFSQFVNSESHALAKFGSVPGFCIQHAYNRLDSGPVGRAAETLVGSETDKALVLHAPFQRSRYNPHPALLRVLEGHANEIHCVAMTPDGKKAVSGSEDRTLRVWDLETGRCLRSLAGHWNRVVSVSITPDGKRAVSGSWDDRLRVWDIETGRCLRILAGHKDSVESATITPDGKRGVSGSKDKTLRIWDVETGRCLRTLEGHTSDVDSVSVTPDGRRAVSGSCDKTLRVWDLETGRCLRVIEGDVNSFRRVSITPDGRRAVSGGGSGGCLCLWDLDTGRRLPGDLKEHTTNVNSVSITPDGRRAVSASGDATLRLWDLDTGRCLRVLAGHTDEINSVSITPDGRRAVSGGKDNALRLWDLEHGSCLRVSQERGGTVNSICVTPDRTRAVSGGAAGGLSLWDLKTGRRLQAFSAGEFEDPVVGITPDGERVVSGGKAPFIPIPDPTPDMILRSPLHLWDMETGRCLRELGGHAYSVSSVSITPDGRRVVSGGADHYLRLWDLETGHCVREYDECGNWIQGITPDGRSAVSGGGGSDNTLRLCDLDGGNCLRSFEGHTGNVNSIGITPDGRRALSGGSDKTLRLWDLGTGRCLWVLEEHTDQVNTVSITPDGTTAISGSNDKTLRLWDLKTGSVLAVYEAGDIVRSASHIGQDGFFVVAAGNAVVLLRLQNVRMETPLVSAIRFWLSGSEGSAGRWDSALKAVCPRCGRRFAVAAAALDLIRAITREAGLKPGQSPCLDLPARAWDEPGLASECPLCRKSLRFNPFLVDGLDAGEAPFAAGERIAA